MSALSMNYDATSTFVSEYITAAHRVDLAKEKPRIIQYEYERLATISILFRAYVNQRFCEMYKDKFVEMLSSRQEKKVIDRLAAIKSKSMGHIFFHQIVDMFEFHEKVDNVTLTLREEK